MYSTKKCEVCGKEYKPRQSQQKYCSRECFFKALPEFRAKIMYEPKAPTIYCCDRTNCIFYKEVGNHCEILSRVYEDSIDCGFYKERKGK